MVELKTATVGRAFARHMEEDAPSFEKKFMIGSRRGLPGHFFDYVV